jgi:hypothetical protein
MYSLFQRCCDWRNGAFSRFDPIAQKSDFLEHRNAGEYAGGSRVLAGVF